MKKHGRPTLYAQKLTTGVRIPLTPSQYARLERAARKLDANMSGVARDWIMEGIKETERKK
ncbi:MAG: hypothetical protein OEQ39_02875 [Gammaproteobacteria bacterium]|nr:hypothetical protein [Gammaproteobacteria bacterium]MDH3375893.1 hypothetical protein [Gammaproteobacteria bacterium]